MSRPGPFRKPILPRSSDRNEGSISLEFEQKLERPIGQELGKNPDQAFLDRWGTDLSRLYTDRSGDGSESYARDFLDQLAPQIAREYQKTRPTATSQQAHEAITRLIFYADEAIRSDLVASGMLSSLQNTPGKKQKDPEFEGVFESRLTLLQSLRVPQPVREILANKSAEGLAAAFALEPRGSGAIQKHYQAVLNTVGLPSDPRLKTATQKIMGLRAATQGNAPSIEQIQALRKPLTTEQEQDTLGGLLGIVEEKIADSLGADPKLTGLARLVHAQTPATRNESVGPQSTSITHISAASVDTRRTEPTKGQTPTTEQQTEEIATIHPSSRRPGPATQSHYQNQQIAHPSDAANDPSPVFETGGTITIDESTILYKVNFVEPDVINAHEHWGARIATGTATVIAASLALGATGAAAHEPGSINTSDSKTASGALDEISALDEEDRIVNGLTAQPAREIIIESEPDDSPEERPYPNLNFAPTPTDIQDTVTPIPQSALTDNPTDRQRSAPRVHVIEIEQETAPDNNNSTGKADNNDISKPDGDTVAPEHNGATVEPEALESANKPEEQVNNDAENVSGQGTEDGSSTDYSSEQNSNPYQEVDEARDITDNNSPKQERPNRSEGKPQRMIVIDVGEPAGTDEQSTATPEEPSDIEQPTPEGLEGAPSETPTETDESLPNPPEEPTQDIEHKIVDRPTSVTVEITPEVQIAADQANRQNDAGGRTPSRTLTIETELFEAKDSKTADNAPVVAEIIKSALEETPTPNSINSDDRLEHVIQLSNTIMDSWENGELNYSTAGLEKLPDSLVKTIQLMAGANPASDLRLATAIAIASRPTAITKNDPFVEEMLTVGTDIEAEAFEIYVTQKGAGALVSTAALSSPEFNLLNNGQRTALTRALCAAMWKSKPEAERAKLTEEYLAERALNNQAASETNTENTEINAENIDYTQIDALVDSLDMSIEGRREHVRTVAHGMVQMYLEGAPVNLEVMMAMALHESFSPIAKRESGVSSLADDYYNYFGMKAGDSWEGKIVRFDTWEDDGHGNRIEVKGVAWRAFGSPIEGMRHHAFGFIGGMPRYERAVASKDSVTGYLAALYDCGYYTDTAYTGKITEMISAYNISEFIGLIKQAGDAAKAQQATPASEPPAPTPTPEAPNPSSSEIDIAKFSKKIVLPFAEGTVIKRTSPYGTRTNPITGQRNTRHLGEDIAVPEGTPVLAMADGIVRAIVPKEETGTDGTYKSRYSTGNVITIYHPQLGDDGEFIETGVAHLQGFAEGLKVGDVVKAGQIIGYIGNTGNSTGPHGHFNVIRAKNNQTRVQWGEENFVDLDVFLEEFGDGIKLPRQYNEYIKIS